MATARAVVVTDVNLTLTLEEAVTLRDLLMKIGGSPTRSRRKHTAAIIDALSGVAEVSKEEWVQDFGPSLHDGLEFYDIGDNDPNF